MKACLKLAADARVPRHGRRGRSARLDRRWLSRGPWGIVLLLLGVVWGAIPVAAHAQDNADDEWGALGFDESAVTPPPASGAEGDDEWAALGFGEEGESNAGASTNGEAEDDGAESNIGTLRYRLRNYSAVRFGAPQKSTDGDDVYVGQLLHAMLALGLDWNYSDGPLRLSAGVWGEYDPRFHSDELVGGTSDRDTYLFHLRPLESYAAVDLGGFTGALGFLEVAWGEALLLSQIDNVAPRDQRRPVISSDDVPRLAVLASRLQYGWGRHELELIAQFERRYDLQPPPLGEYSLLRNRLLAVAAGLGLTLDPNLVRFEHPEEEYALLGDIAVHEPETYLRYTYRGSLGDVALFGMRRGDRQGVIALPTPADFAAGRLNIRVTHPITHTVGTALSAKVGGVLAYGELAVDIERPVNTLVDNGVIQQIAEERRTLYRWVLGLRYSPGTSMYAVEYAHGTASDSEDDAPTLVPLADPTLAFVVQSSFQRERLQTRWVTAFVGPSLAGGSVVQGEVSWQWTDGLRIGFSALAFLARGEQSPISGMGRETQVGLRVAYDGFVF